MKKNFVDNYAWWQTLSRFGGRLRVIFKVTDHRNITRFFDIKKPRNCWNCTQLNIDSQYCYADFETEPKEYFHKRHNRSYRSIRPVRKCVPFKSDTGTVEFWAYRARVHIATECKKEDTHETST